MFSQAPLRTFSLELFHMTLYIYSWYKVLAHWKLKLLSFLIDAVLIFFVFLYDLLMSFLIWFINFKEIRDFLFLRKSRLYYFVTVFKACKQYYFMQMNFTKFGNLYFMGLQLHNFGRAKKPKTSTFKVLFKFHQFSVHQPICLVKFYGKNLF